MDHQEQFLKFLDPELCELSESHESGGLRTLHLTYTFQDFQEDKELFRIGNKIWISGDVNLTDCLYVINTEVKQDVYQENSFTLEAEEVLVELNYAPLFNQNELSKKDSDNNPVFTLSTTNGKQEVTVNWNALNYWFGNYFNIGVVQKCISEYAGKCAVNGTMNRMSLLRYLEEETGNVFVTRYEKDLNSNVIHRYLDFLNPINSSKDWEFNLCYDFIDLDTTGDGVLDEDGNPTTDTYEDVEDEDDIVILDPSRTWTNLDPENTEFRFTDKNGEVLVAGSDELTWNAYDDLGLEDDSQAAVISICKNGNTIGLDVGTRSFSAVSNDQLTTGDVDEPGFMTVAADPDTPVNTVLPDDCYFEIYDTVKDKALFRTVINSQIGTVHEDVIDFGFNMENVVYNIDESETYHAISPVLSLKDSNGLNRTQLGSLISDWGGLSVSKGDVIPMIVEKVNIKASSLANAKSALGTYNLHSNYWVRPYNPQDNTDASSSSDYTWEFYRATAYWKAPYSKNSNSLYVETDKTNNTQYSTILNRPDNRNTKGNIYTPKLGTTDSDDENIYAIYNQVALYLKDHEAPDIDIDVDIANLRGLEYNNYQIHDKVYIKLPDTQELVTARVTSTSKEANDVAQNKIKLSNYSINTVKTLQNDTYIECNNTSFTYPKKKTITARLINQDYDNTDPYKNVQYPANKLLTFTVKNGNEIQKIYNKKTNSTGYASITLQLDPGDYTVTVDFGGDEEYFETSLDVDVNVNGTKKEANKTSTKKTKQKTTKKNKGKSKIQKYYSKYGLSPNKKTIMAIGKRSTSKDPGSDTEFYATEFKNKCPKCGHASLHYSIFWAGTNKDYGKFPATGKKEHGSKTGRIICSHCDTTYSALGNQVTKSNNGKKLTVTTKTKKSKKENANKLIKGDYPYGEIIKNAKNRKTTSNKTRTVAGSINKAVKQQALKIVGDSKGWAAAKKISQWMDRHIAYVGYGNFIRSPVTVLNKRGGNCCDQTRLFLQMCDAAGCTEYLNMYYVHVHEKQGHVYAQIKHKTTGKKVYVDCASDYHVAWGYVCQGYSHGSPASTYPNQPF